MLFALISTTGPINLFTLHLAANCRNLARQDICCLVHSGVFFDLFIICSAHTVNSSEIKEHNHPWTSFPIGRRKWLDQIRPNGGGGMRQAQASAERSL